MSVLGNQDLLAKLGTIASVLAFVAGTSVTTTSPELATLWDVSPSYAVCATSTTSTTTTASEVLPSARAVALAMAEVGIARRVLKVRELAQDGAFLTYLNVVNEALDAYGSVSGNPEEQGRRMTALVGNLAAARAALEGSVSSLSTWVALAAAAQPGNRYPSVPQRFQNREQVMLAYQPDPSAEDIESWLALDLVAHA